MVMVIQNFAKLYQKARIDGTQMPGNKFEFQMIPLQPWKIELPNFTKSTRDYKKEYEIINMKTLKIHQNVPLHYGEIIMSAIASQITAISIVCSIVFLGADQREYQSSASLAFVGGIHQWTVNSPHKRPVTRIMFSFDDVIIMFIRWLAWLNHFSDSAV